MDLAGPNDHYHGDVRFDLSTDEKLAEFMSDFILNHRTECLVPISRMPSGKPLRKHLMYINNQGLSNDFTKSDFNLISVVTFIYLWEFGKFDKKQSFHRHDTDEKCLFFFGIGRRERIVIGSFNISFKNQFYVDVPPCGDIKRRCIQYIQQTTRFITQLKRYMTVRKASELSINDFTVSIPKGHPWKLDIIFNNLASLELKKGHVCTKKDRVYYKFIVQK